MPRTALIVDDSNTMLEMVSFTLTQAGYAVVQGKDGRDGLEKAKGKKADVVITDLNMPVMDGISLIKELRALPDYKFTPMLLLTTEAGEEKKQQGKAAGASGWLVKPFNPEQLLKVLARVLP